MPKAHVPSSAVAVAFVAEAQRLAKLVHRCALPRRHGFWQYQLRS
jgi:hypothetical protein